MKTNSDLVTVEKSVPFGGPQYPYKRDIAVWFRNIWIIVAIFLATVVGLQVF